MKKSLISFALFSALYAHAEVVFNRDNGAEPKSIDPQIASESSGAAILYDTFEGLTKTDISGKIVPGVAEKWDISEDGLTYTFHLRKDAKWSDGRPVTAYDFVYGWQRAVNPETGSEYAFILSGVENADEIASGKVTNLETLGIKASDDYTVVVKLKHPVPYFLELTSFYATFPAPMHVIEKHQKAWTQPENIVSNGAYKITAWTPQSTITAQKSEHYWDKNNVQIDKVVYHVIEDASSSLKRYRAGEIDFGPLPTEQLDWAKKNIPDEVKIYPYATTYWYGFNLEHEKFKDNKKLREALYLALDRDVIAEKVLKAGQVPAFSVVSPKMNNSLPFESPYTKLSQAERIELAKKAYAEAGYSKEKPFKSQILYNTSEGHKQIAVAVAAMWKQNLGAEIELLNKEWKVMLSDVSQGKSEIYRYGWHADYNDPNTFLEIFKSNSGTNHSRYKNPEFDAKVQQAAETVDLNERAKVLQEAETMLMNDFPVVPVYHYVRVALVKPYVKGFTPSLMGIIPTQYLRVEK
ncbi:MAG: peptide ABC transporter substrate-binding protein [Cardiobacteriaceae bacterium]|nr:peptide ABC transporter substrate-binding protein [Cardiobacteriaceae bacterium]